MPPIFKLFFLFGIFLAPTAAAAFTDVAPDDPRAPAIASLAERGIAGGYPDGSFRPDRAVSRAEALKIVLLAEGIPIAGDGAKNFPDVPAGHWAGGIVATGKARGIVRGAADGFFHPEEKISRAAGLVMFARASGAATESPELPPFVDVRVTDWFAPEAAWAHGRGIVDGPALRPADPLTRGELAEMIARMDGAGSGESFASAEPEILNKKSAGEASPRGGSATLVETTGEGDFQKNPDPAPDPTPATPVCKKFDATERFAAEREILEGGVDAFRTECFDDRRNHGAGIVSAICEDLFQKTAAALRSYETPITAAGIFGDEVRGDACFAKVDAEVRDRAAVFRNFTRRILRDLTTLHKIYTDELAGRGKIVVAGMGDDVSEPIRLRAGLAMVRVERDGAGYFTVKMLDPTGRTVDRVASEIGPFVRTEPLRVPADGEFLFAIEGDGPWKIAIDQPRPTRSDAAAWRDLAGIGDAVGPFIWLDEGLHIFELEHAGLRNFIVRLRDKNGDQAGTSWANEIGPASAKKAVRIDKPGIYFLEITADGPWTIQQK